MSGFMDLNQPKEIKKRYELSDWVFSVVKLEDSDMVKYDFKEMVVDRGSLAYAISGELCELGFAFVWDCTPQGATYWADQAEGRTELQVDVLKDMLEQYDAWVAKDNYDSEDIVGYDLGEDHEEDFNTAPNVFSEALSDNVNSPSHYGQGSIECIDYIKDFLNDDEYQGYLRGNIAKYLHRWPYKNGVEDLKKAKWYLEELIKVEERD